MCAIAVQGLSDGSNDVFPTSFKLSFAYTDTDHEWAQFYEEGGMERVRNISQRQTLFLYAVTDNSGRFSGQSYSTFPFRYPRTLFFISYSLFHLALPIYHSSILVSLYSPFSFFSLMLLPPKPLSIPYSHLPFTHFPIPTIANRHMHQTLYNIVNHS